MACSSPCYYVLALTINDIEIVVTKVHSDGKLLKALRALPLFIGTVLKKEGDKYGIEQDLLYGDTKLISVAINEDNVKNLVPIDKAKHEDEINMSKVIINLMYAGLSISDDKKAFIATSSFMDGIYTLGNYVDKWAIKGKSNCCAIAGGRRRPKKSRRSRSSRKRRQTRSK